MLRRQEGQCRGREETIASVVAHPRDKMACVRSGGGVLEGILGIAGFFGREAGTGEVLRGGDAECGKLAKKAPAKKAKKIAKR